MRMSFGRCLSLGLLCLASAASTAVAMADDLAQQPGVVLKEFVFEDGPVPECHASTIENTPSGLVVAWFAGQREGTKDVGIWFSRQQDGRWTKPVELFTGVSENQQFPTWNPVLFQPSSGPLLLYYKAGPKPHSWWGLWSTSSDHGVSWTTPKRLPEGILGPIKNKPVELPDGAFLSGSSTEHAGWRVHMERSTDRGATWIASEPLNTKDEMGAIQPTIVRFGKELRILCRSQQGKVATATSTDEGRTWSKLSFLDLPNPNSGIDAVTLKDGRAVLIYNHTPKGRSPLNVGLSSNGVDWKSVALLENDPGEYSYPAVIQTADGRVHVTYTWKRKRVRHVVLDPTKWAR